jgi:hypothetical protein
MDKVQKYNSFNPRTMLFLIFHKWDACRLTTSCDISSSLKLERKKLGRLSKWRCGKNWTHVDETVIGNSRNPVWDVISSLTDALEHSVRLTSNPSKRNILVLTESVSIYLCQASVHTVNTRGRIQKCPDWVDKEIYAYNNKHSLRSNTKCYGGKTH